MNAFPKFAEAKRILVRGVNWLGDAVMSTPALLRLREACPNSEIVLLTHEKLEQLWLHHPVVDKTITFAAKESAWAVAKKLKSLQFDAALVFPNSPRSAIEVWLAGIPARVGLRTPWRSLFLTHPVEPTSAEKMRKRTRGEIQRLARNPVQQRQTYPVSAHQIHHYLRLVGSVGADPEICAPRIAVKDEEVDAACEKFGFLKKGYGQRPFFGLNDGAEYGPAKRWPLERFVETADAIRKSTDCIWIVCGGNGDRELAASISGQIESRAGDVINLAGKTSLRELCAVLKSVRVLLTNDTGPMHVAAGVGTPVVVPFGSTSPELTGPGLPDDPNHRFILGQAACAPCFLRECPIDFRCMKSIGAEKVTRALIDALRT